MAKRITPRAIRKNNRKLIYNYIYKQGKVSQNDIASVLHLSRPTITTNISELEEDGLIFKDGQQDSDQIGRKAIVYSAVANYRIAIGVELTRRHAKIIAIDLFGAQIKRVIHSIRYENSKAYFKTVCEYIKDFIESLEVSDERVLGIGIAMQGLVSPDGNDIVYGEILQCTGLNIRTFSDQLPFRCTFIHDPEGAALSELWVSPDLNSAIYLSLSEHLGGALILNRSISRGKSGHSATFEHIQYSPDGEPCYCGKVGCYETYLSMTSLLGEEDSDEFFDKARQNETPESRKWQDYLRVLGSLIGSIHLVTDVDFILGGHLAPYITEDDIQVLYDIVEADCPFEEMSDFITISKMPSHNINIGAALPFIIEFINDTEPIAGE